MDGAREIELTEPLARRIERLVSDAKYLLLGLASRWLLAKRERSLFDETRTFCAFVGYGRSGGTLVGALLNAHPDIVVSNELNAIRRLRLGLSESQLCRLIYLVSARQVRRGSKGGGGYSYAVPRQWQGRCRNLLVIGDRKAGATAYEILSNPHVLQSLARKIRLEKKFIHVIRNPYDTIATTYQKTVPRQGEDSDAHLSREIRNFFARSSAVELIEKQFGPGSVHHLHHERLIEDPLRHLQRICDFLGVEANPDYLADCASILKPSPNLSRNALTWSAGHVAAVSQGMKRWPWLADYDPNP